MLGAGKGCSVLDAAAYFQKLSGLHCGRGKATGRTGGHADGAVIAVCPDGVRMIKDTMGTEILTNGTGCFGLQGVQASAFLAGRVVIVDKLLCKIGFP